MHKMSTKMHKKDLITSDITNSETIYDLDIEKENRISKIISLCSKGFTQDEIATQLGVNQSTISRDMQIIKKQVRSQLDKYFRNDVLFEFTRYLYGSSEVIKELWGIVEYCNDDPKQKTTALKLLLQAYERRHLRIIGGPESYLNMKRTESDLDYQDFIERDPTVKAMAQMQKLDPKANIFGGKFLDGKMT